MANHLLSNRFSSIKPKRYTQVNNSRNRWENWHFRCSSRISCSSSAKKMIKLYKLISYLQHTSSLQYVRHQRSGPKVPPCSVIPGRILRLQCFGKPIPEQAAYHRLLRGIQRSELGDDLRVQRRYRVEQNKAPHSPSTCRK